MRNRLLALQLVGLLLTSNWVAAAPPDLIVTHAKVVTVDPKFSIAEAFAIREGRIVAVGKNDEILALAGDNTQKLNLGGKTVIPGLCDSHVRPTGGAVRVRSSHSRNGHDRGRVKVHRGGRSVTRWRTGSASARCL